MNEPTVSPPAEVVEECERCGGSFPLSEIAEHRRTCDDDGSRWPQAKFQGMMPYLEGSIE